QSGEEERESVIEMRVVKRKFHPHRQKQHCAEEETARRHRDVRDPCSLDHRDKNEADRREDENGAQSPGPAKGVEACSSSQGERADLEHGMPPIHMQTTADSWSGQQVAAKCEEAPRQGAVVQVR